VSSPPGGGGGGAWVRASSPRGGCGAWVGACSLPAAAREPRRALSPAAAAHGQGRGPLPVAVARGHIELPYRRRMGHDEFISLGGVRSGGGRPKRVPAPHPAGRGAPLVLRVPPVGYEGEDAR